MCIYLDRDRLYIFVFPLINYTHILICSLINSYNIYVCNPLRRRRGNYCLPWIVENSVSRMDFRLVRSRQNIYLYYSYPFDVYTYIDITLLPLFRSPLGVARLFKFYLCGNCCAPGHASSCTTRSNWICTLASSSSSLSISDGNNINWKYKKDEGVWWEILCYLNRYYTDTICMHNLYKYERLNWELVFQYTWIQVLST